jgi:hypothetical protein
MDKLTWEKLTEVDGFIEAEVLQSFLQANDVPVELLREAGTPSTYAFTMDEMACVEVYVPREKIEQARDLLVLFNTPPDEEEPK